MIKWIKRKINTPYLFRQPEMVSSFHQLLLALAVLDIIYVTTNIVDYSVVKVISFFLDIIYVTTNIVDYSVVKMLRPFVSFSKT